MHFATGHGQLGLTLGATTARLIADQIAGRTTPSKLAAFSPDRFLTS
jgi:D-amino-acid dehydrogenase